MLERDIGYGMETVWVRPDELIPKINLKETFGVETTKHKARMLVMRHLTVFLLQVAKKYADATKN
jgi:hypothetical protein